MDGKVFYRTVLGIQDHKLINELGKQSEVRGIKKGTVIQNAGEDCKFTSFLICGLFRSFFLDANGNEVTDSFSYLPGTPLVASMEVKGPAVVSVEALEDSEILLIKTDVVNELVSTQIGMALLYAQLISNTLQMHWENKVAVSNHTAKARYVWFQNQFPGLIHRISHKYVASFLGMTPVSLSRVRRSIRETQE